MRRRFMNNLSNSFDVSNYMTIEALEDNVEIIMPRVVEYGIDGEGWKKYKGSIIINLGQTASFKYILPPMQNINFGRIVINGEYKLCGNCLSLIFGDNIQYDLTGYNQCFKELFFGNKGLLSVEPHFLPATTLVSYCYSYMFGGCTKLNYIKMLATDISAHGCLSWWVNGVASSGTFVKNPAMTALSTGVSGIPRGWTVVNDGEESVNLITFYVADSVGLRPNFSEYTATEGMTWGEWIDSEYNTSDLYKDGEYILTSDGLTVTSLNGGGSATRLSDVIVNGEQYYRG